jgi:hypothetical protein
MSARKFGARSALLAARDMRYPRAVRLGTATSGTATWQLTLWLAHSAPVAPVISGMTRRVAAAPPGGQRSVHYPGQWPHVVAVRLPPALRAPSTHSFRRLPAGASKEAKEDRVLAGKGAGPWKRLPTPD